MPSSKCEHRSTFEVTPDLDVTREMLNFANGLWLHFPNLGRPGKHSNRLCELLIKHSGTLHCIAPSKNTNNCPLARYFMGQITLVEAHRELHEIHGTSGGFETGIGGSGGQEG